MNALSRRRFLTGTGLAVLGSLLPSCSTAPTITAVPEARSTKPHQLDGNTSPSDLKRYASGHNAFGFALYGLLRDNPGNLFFSPYSVAQALTMTSAGARGATLQQMAQVLHSAFPQERLHATANALDLALSSRASTKDGFSLEIANSLWGQRGYTFRPEFLDLLAENYGTGLRLLDFKADPEQARNHINAAIAQQTHDNIKELLPPESINKATVLALTNAIYFNAVWRSPFESYNTSDQPFHLDDGTVVMAPRMVQERVLRYAITPEYQAVVLPYQGDVSMLVVMPPAGGLADFEQRLSVELLQAIQGKLGGQYIDIGLPKFTYQPAGILLNETLKQLGMTDVFNPEQADFSGMDGIGNLCVNDVIHQAMVRVDEKGTEAAAATSVTMIPASEPVKAVPVIVDRPFFFAIQDDATGTILFMGRIVNPLMTS